MHVWVFYLIYFTGISLLHSDTLFLLKHTFVNPFTPGNLY